MTETSSPLHLITSLDLTCALNKRKCWCAAGQENAQGFSTRTMVKAYVQCYAALAGGVTIEPNGLVSESGRGA